MKIKRLFFLLLFFLSFIFFTSAQKISLNFTDVKLESVLHSISKKTGYTFAYSHPFINIDSSVTIKIKRVEIDEALRELFANTDICFEINGKKIFLSRKEAPTQAPKSDIITIIGIVSDEDGVALPYASIIENGTTNGTITDSKGYYSLDVNKSSKISVSFLGYLTQQIEVNGEKIINVTLKTNVHALNEVIVTALGIKKEEQSLSYSVDKLSTFDLNTVKDINMINSLAGKTTGIQINRSSSGLGASSKVQIRGGRSISGNNQPLYVIDGIPIINISGTDQIKTSIGGIADAGNRDSGDGISNLNPEDIESMTILKGAAASALYGSRAANGVVVITTKRGNEGKPTIRFSSAVQASVPVSLPEFQNNYGRGEGTNDSWGSEIDSPSFNNLHDFYRTGVHAFTTLSLTAGSNRSQSYFSYGNTKAKGIVEKNELSRHNISVREIVKFYEGRLTMDANINIIYQKIANRLPPGGYYMNPLVGLYTFPRGMNLSKYKTNFETYNSNRNLFTQNWYTKIDDFEQNPYWLLNRAQSMDKRLRTIASISGIYKPSDWFSLQARANMDFIIDKYRQEMYASTSVGLAGDNGRLIDHRSENTLIYADLIAFLKKSYNNYTFTFDIGGSLSDYKENPLRLDSKSASLYFPNVFTISNIKINSSSYIDESSSEELSLSAFMSMQIAYLDKLYLNVTARNEWSSTLAFTKSAKTGFFYPSIGISWLLNNTFVLPDWIYSAKIRTSWSKVGNGLIPYSSRPEAKIMAGGEFLSTHIAPYDDLKPEMSSSLEFGFDWSFFNQRLNFDFTAYNTNTRNQLFMVQSSAGAEYKYYYVNAGNIQNRGLEMSLKAIPVLRKDFKWSAGINFSTNKNTVIELYEKIPVFYFGDEGFSSSYSMELREGASFGDIYGKVFDRDNYGNIIYEDGLPRVKEGTNYTKVGNCNPDFMSSLTNMFVYKNFSLYFLLDARFGGKILSQTQAELDARGVSQNTGLARDNAYVELEGVRISDIEAFYKLVGSRSGVTEYYMYDATNVRLREISLSYTIPEKIIGKTGFLNNIQFSVVGQNLFFLYKKAPFDPDAVLSTANDNQGIDVFGLPLTRNFGFNLKITF